MQTIKVRAGAWVRPPAKTTVAPEHEATKKRLMAKVKLSPETGCWEWQGAKSNGYSSISVNGKCQRGHRVSYGMFVEAIPAGLQIDHLCCNRACVNPRHLEPVTARQNSSNRVIMRKAGLMPVIGREADAPAKDWHKDLNFAHLDRAIDAGFVLRSDPETLRQNEELFNRASKWSNRVRHDY